MDRSEIKFINGGSEITGSANTNTVKTNNKFQIDPELHKNDLVNLLYAEIERKTIAGHHIQSMNTFYSIGLKQIITKIFKIELDKLENKRNSTEEDREIKEINCVVIFTDVKIKPPSTLSYSSGNPAALTPNKARLGSLTYSAGLYVDATITATAFLKNGGERVRTEQVKDLRIASIPVMVGTQICTTYDQTKETLKYLEEDPHDIGGYFIIKGNEWVVEMIENSPMNNFQVFRNMYKKEIARGTFISKPGDYYDNSIMLTLCYLTNQAITVELTINVDEKLTMPFYILFRLFGMTNDRDIINHIIYGIDNNDIISKTMLNVLLKAFTVEESRAWNPVRNSTDPVEILEHVSKLMNESLSKNTYKRDENMIKWYNMKTLQSLDSKILPHLGITPDTRIKKLRFLGHLIHKLLLVELEVVESSDRDSYENKRIHSAGVNIAKTLKTQFNFAVVQEVRKHLKNDFESMEFSKVGLAEILKTAVKPTELEKVMTKVITASSTKFGKGTIPNRTVSQPLYRKNDLNAKSQINAITINNNSAAKQTERADDMRRVHPTYIGYICISQSADTGEKVGIIKQLACSASICEASDSQFLKKVISSDPDTILLDNVLPEEIMSRNLCKIFVNGDWIGFCEKSYDYVKKYRLKRRRDEIHYQTTILWKELTREIYFWVDVGRIIRPLIIVYNNIDEYISGTRSGKSVEFNQYIKLTKDHIIQLLGKKISMEDLRQQQIIEYISAEEQQNTYLAYNLDILRENANNVLTQYTHCDIEQSVFGLLALASPCGSHTPGTRTTYSTNQKKQTCGWFALNFPYRMDKHTFWQHYCQLPIIKCFSDTISYPNNQNLISAYMMYSGFNQEDSCIINKSSVDRGLFNGCHYYYEKTELQKGEIIGLIDRVRTMDVKKNAIYQYLDDKGIIRPNTIISKNYVLVSKYEQLSKPVVVNNITYQFKDKSIVYREEESAIVERVIFTRNDDGTQICQVKLRSNRPIQVGDKISTRMGNKGIVCSVLSSEDMPYAEDGLVPDIITTPNSIPTRMCVGQVIEGILAELAVRKGCIYDATTFFKTDYKYALEELEKEGIKYGGYRRLFNGKTGTWIDTLIFMVPTSYNRLAKFVKDNSYAVNSGPTNAITRQPLDGKQNNGGLRIGEMEKDVLMAHGAPMTLEVKFSDDSDGIMLPICRICGNVAIVNDSKGMYKCRKCKQNASISMVPSTWITNVLIHEITAMNIGMNFKLKPYEYTVRAIEN